MKKYKYMDGNQWLFILTLDGPDHDIVPETPAAEKYVEDLRALMPLSFDGEEITFHERYGAQLAQWLRVLLYHHEGIDLDIIGVKDIPKKSVAR